MPEMKLISKEVFFKLHEDFFGEGSGSCSEIDDTDLCYHVAQAQLAADQKVLREMVEEIEVNSEPGYKEGELGIKPPTHMFIEGAWWQAFKKKCGV